MYGATHCRKWVCDSCKNSWDRLMMSLVCSLNDWRGILVWTIVGERLKWLLWCLIVIWLLWCLGVLDMLWGKVGVICSLDVLAKEGCCVGDIWILGVLIIVILPAMVWWTLLLLRLDVWHVLIVGLCVYGSVILLGRGCE